MNDAVIDLSMGRKQNNTQLSIIEFECPACGQEVKGDRGYYIQHDVIVISPYGLPEQHICPASNNKIKAELRSLKMHGECENCHTEMDLVLTEDYPGGLKQEGGWLETTCLTCNGKQVAICDTCGGHLEKFEGPATIAQYGCVVYADVADPPEWIHITGGLAECPGQILAEDTDDDTEEELDSEFFTAAPKEFAKASPMQGSIHTNPFHKVVVRDDFTITLSEDDNPHQDQEVSE